MDKRDNITRICKEGQLFTDSHKRLQGKTKILFVIARILSLNLKTLYTGYRAFCNTSLSFTDCWWLCWFRRVRTEFFLQNYLLTLLKHYPELPKGKETHKEGGPRLHSCTFVGIWEFLEDSGLICHLCNSVANSMFYGTKQMMVFSLNQTLPAVSGISLFIFFKSASQPFSYSQWFLFNS